jgi:bifunctional UDP-N-acetylglucosamine pyrophosphorylase / glucosamine-1-phosphate N-acetyltransferase
MSDLSVIVLAAGEGTRMRSATTAKVLFGFAGRSLLDHVLAASAALDPAETVVVVGHRRDHVIAHLERHGPPAKIVVQPEQDGTGHAVRLALDALPDEPAGKVVVLPGDTPLLRSATLLELYHRHLDTGAAATMLTSVMADPTGYGRVIRKGDDVVRVVEHRDATADELSIKEVATSVYAFDTVVLREAVTRLSSHNAQGEQYLPDVIDVLVRQGRTVAALLAPENETAGVNDRAQLASAHRLFNARLLDEHMRLGVTVVDPATTWVDVSVSLAPDVTLLPGTDLRGRTSVDRDAVIGPHTTLVDTTVGERSTIERAVCRGSVVGADVTIGPYAYLRPGSELADGVHIGTFVEVKASQVGTGTKIPHLSYVGDATIGEHTNIGAATVFVNFDGVAKHRTTIGSHVRSGADNMFVAPVSVGDGAYTGAGSVICEDVPPGALGVARARQTNVRDWVARRRPGTPADAAARRARDESSGAAP